MSNKPGTRRRRAPGGSSHRASRISPRVVRETLAALGDASWSELTRHLGLRRGPESRNLRRTLEGLVASGDVEASRNGRYQPCGRVFGLGVWVEGPLRCDRTSGGAWPGVVRRTCGCGLQRADRSRRQATGVPRRHRRSGGCRRIGRWLEGPGQAPRRVRGRSRPRGRGDAGGAPDPAVPGPSIRRS